jgi:hypothetical protein
MEWNKNHVLIAAALVLAAGILAAGNRWEVRAFDKNFFVKIDRWTGDVYRCFFMQAECRKKSI